MGTENVKLGVCKVTYGGVDLGLTKGGVEVEVTTDTHPVTVDQFGESEINEYIMKRSVKVKCPLAETTLENMVSIMPGASLVDNGTKQVTTVSVDTVGNDTMYTVTIDGVAHSYTSDASATEGEIALGLVAALNANSSNGMIAATTAVAADVTATLTLTARVSGKVHTVTTTANLSTTATTAAAEGAKRVDVTNGLGTDLLSIAQELILHPIGLPDSDKSEDFVIPRAATAGALQFAYRFDDERIFNVEFTGYPNSTTKKLFHYGDSAAT